MRRIIEIDDDDYMHICNVVKSVRESLKEGCAIHNIVPIGWTAIADSKSYDEAHYESYLKGHKAGYAVGYEFGKVDDSSPNPNYAEIKVSTDEDASDNGCTTCRYENLDCLDHPCNSCVHGIAGCKANMWEPK